MIGIQMFKKVAKKALGRKINPLSDYRYSIDVVDPTQVAGWAKNIKLPSHTPIIDLYVDNTLTWQAKCNQPRADLIEQKIGSFAFSFVPNASSLSKSCSEVRIHIDGHPLPHLYPLNILVQGSKENSQDNSVSSSTSKKYLFHIDRTTPNEVFGWAKINHPDNNERLNIELRAGQNILAAGVASIFRQDLLNNQIGDGKFAFELDLDLAEFPTDTLLADVYIDGELYERQSVSLSVSEHEVEQAKFSKQFAPQVAQLQKSLNDETRRIYKSLESIQGNDPSVQNTLDFILKSIAEMNVRMSIIEKNMLKNLKK